MKLLASICLGNAQVDTEGLAKVIAQIAISLGILAQGQSVYFSVDEGFLNIFFTEPVAEEIH